MTCVIVLQWKCSLAISKWRTVETWTTLSTFFTFFLTRHFKKRKKSRFSDFGKKGKTYSRTMPRVTFWVFFLAHLWRSDLSTDFDAKWLKRRAFTQGWYFCSKNRNFSYPLISRAPKSSKFYKFLNLENFCSIWPLTLKVTERTPLILHRSPMKVA